MTRLFINVGADDNVQARHFVDAITSCSSIAARQIGAIALYGRYTFVDVPTETADQIIIGLNRQKIGQPPGACRKERCPGGSGVRRGIGQTL